ncbi:hypothetical protein CDL12_29456, partial [Handroanthus impetiginosus]
MGNLLVRFRKHSSSDRGTVAGRASRSVNSARPRSLSSSFANQPFDGLQQRNQNHMSSESTVANNSETKNTAGGVGGMASSRSQADRKKKYGYIPDNYTSIEQVTAALRESGLESSNLILGIDFTKSNEWTGKVSFNNRSLHAIGDTPNPYEKAISIIGKTLAPFDEDNLIPCFGFGDATTHDQEVFSFHTDHSSCHGFEEVLACYKRILPNLRLSGPTSYGPVVDAAVDIVEKSRGQYHVLVIIADGQVNSLCLCVCVCVC